MLLNYGHKNELMCKPYLSYCRHLITGYKDIGTFRKLKIMLLALNPELRATA
jgi:hypothetical protein